MICEKCGKINPGKNTVCSSCNAPLPVSKSCGGFEDILTINAPAPETSTTSAAVSSVSGARTDAAIMKLNASNEELKKKNSFLMISSIAAAGISLIALIVAIVAIVSPSVSSVKINSLESEVSELKDEVNEIVSGDNEIETYHCVENDIVYNFIKDFIETDLMSSFENSDDNGIPTNSDNFDILNNYLDSAINKLDTESHEKLGKLLNSKFMKYYSDAFINWLQENYSNIHTVYVNSDDYKVFVAVTVFTDLCEIYTENSNNVKEFKLDKQSENLQDKYNKLSTEYKKSKENLNNHFEDNKEILENNNIKSLPFDEVADIRIQDLDYYFKGDYTISFKISEKETKDFLLKNEDKFVTEKIDDNPNVLPAIDASSISEGEKFVGWSTLEMPEDEKDCYTNAQLTEKSVYEFFKDKDDENDKTIELYPIFAKEGGYKVIYLDEEGNEIDDVSSELPYYVLKEDDYPDEPTNDPYSAKDGNRTFKGYKIEDKDEIFTKEDFISKNISAVDGSYTQYFEDNLIIYFKDFDDKLVVSYDNASDEKFTDDIITAITDKLNKDNNTYKILTSTDDKAQEINIANVKDKTLNQVVNHKNDGTTEVTWYVEYAETETLPSDNPNAFNKN